MYDINNEFLNVSLSPTRVKRIPDHLTDYEIRHETLKEALDPELLVTSPSFGISRAISREEPRSHVSSARFSVSTSRQRKLGAFDPSTSRRKNCIQFSNRAKTLYGYIAGTENIQNNTESAAHRSHQRQNRLDEAICPIMMVDRADEVRSLKLEVPRRGDCRIAQSTDHCDRYPAYVLIASSRRFGMPIVND